MSRFVVAVRRNSRLPGVSANLVSETPGVTVISTSTRGRLVIEADEATASHILLAFGDRLIIEPEILHTTL